MTKIPDESQRQQALDPGVSFICEAPAGSGKTELLTQRYLTLLARVNQPEEILAITFTRKAAGEMRDRILLALARGAEDRAPDSDHAKKTWLLARDALKVDRSHDWQLLNNPSRLQIKTFDSLCAGLANSLPLHSSFATPPKVSEDAEVIYLHATQSFLATLESNESWSPALAEVFRLLDNNMSRIESLFVAMLAKREAWLPLVMQARQQEDLFALLEAGLQQVRMEVVEQVKALMPLSVQHELIELASFAASQCQRLGQDSSLLLCLNLNLNTSELPGSDPDAIELWLALSDLLLTTDHSWRKTLTVKNGFPAKGETSDETKALKAKKSEALALIDKLSSIAGLESAFAALRFLPNPHYSDEQRAFLDVLLQLLPVLSAHLNLSFQEHNQVDFTEVSMRARAALGMMGSPSELALALDYKLQHLLVDEFQDTSPAQIELLTRLTEGWQPDDGRTLFCVGDAMQSIYGFRDANVGLFLRCLQEGLGDIALTPLKLHSNFRSCATVVEWINQVFEKAFPEKSDIALGAVSYSVSEPIQQSDSQARIECLGFCGDRAEHAQADAIVDIVREKKSQEPDGTIAILVRNRKHAAQVLPKLKTAGFRYRAVDLEPLDKHSVIQDLMALTQAMRRPEDRIAWLAVLRAPWAGMTLRDLEGIANIAGDDDRPLTLLQQLRCAVSQCADSETIDSQVDFFSSSEACVTPRLSSHGLAVAKRILPVLDKAVFEQQRKSLRHWVEGVWLALGGASCLKSEEEHSNASVFFDLLERLEQSADQSYAALESAVVKLFAAPDPLGDEKLQIMTIHKAKGLEFDTVIVPALDRASKSKERELLTWAERVNAQGENELLMSPITVSGRDSEPNVTYLNYLEKQRQKNESCRLFYVACTRAKKNLYLLAELKKSTSKSGDPFKAPTGTSLLATVWSAIKLKMQVTELEEQADNNSDDSEWVPKKLARLPSQWRGPSLPEGHLLDDYIPFYQHDNKDVSTPVWQDATASQLGTVIHRILQDLNLSQIYRWRDSGFEPEQARWRSLLVNIGVARPQLESSLGYMQELMSTLVSDSNHHWLFDDKVEFRESELALTVAHNAAYADYVLDLVIRDGRGVLWLVDYKTTAPEEGEPEEDFARRMVDRYRVTMMRYRQAVIEAGIGAPKVALYLPAVARLEVYE